MGFTKRTESLKLHNGLEDLIICHLSDLHLWGRKKKTQTLIKFIHVLNPEIIICTGDYFDTYFGAKLFYSFIQELSSTYPIVFIAGNHDIIFGAKTLNRISNIENCTYLRDTNFNFRSKKGFEYELLSWENIETLNDSKNTKIVLLHNPEKIIESKLNKIDLILAGHLHGGQFIFWKTKSNTFFPGCLLYNYCLNRKKINNTTLIVSKGLGDSFPFRFNCAKEVVEIRVT